MKTLFLTSEKAQNKEDTFKILRNYSEVVTHYGQFSLEFVLQNSIGAILSDRNGYIIPSEIIEAVNGRVYNTHPSLLPLHRGAQPIFFAIYEKTAVGVSIHQVNSYLDKGPLVCSSEVHIAQDDTLINIYSKCRSKIIELLTENWPKMLSGSVELFDQKGKGCYHSKKEFDELIFNLERKWQSTPQQVRNLAGP